MSRRIKLLVLCFLVSVPIGAIGQAFATSCLDPGTTATLEIRSITIDGAEASDPAMLAPASASFHRTLYEELAWTNRDGTSERIILGDGQ
ncbi:MAG: hypothetical protein IT378_18900 [Sandaracinaceae bacterium]|nr:hypothetical protein [Sandaracinaceae bacterium]